MYRSRQVEDGERLVCEVNEDAADCRSNSQTREQKTHVQREILRSTASVSAQVGVNGEECTSCRDLYYQLCMRKWRPVHWSTLRHHK